MKSIKNLNKIAKEIGLELVKGDGYFYWWFINEEDDLKYCHLKLESIYVVHFNRMKFEKWIDEYKSVKEIIENENKEILQRMQGF